MWRGRGPLLHLLCLTLFTWLTFSQSHGLPASLPLDDRSGSPGGGEGGSPRTYDLLKEVSGRRRLGELMAVAVDLPEGTDEGDMLEFSVEGLSGRYQVQVPAAALASNGGRGSLQAHVPASPSSRQRTIRGISPAVDVIIVKRQTAADDDDPHESALRLKAERERAYKQHSQESEQRLKVGMQAHWGSSSGGKSSLLSPPDPISTADKGRKNADDFQDDDDGRVDDDEPPPPPPRAQQEPPPPSQTVGTDKLGPSAREEQHENKKESHHSSATHSSSGGSFLSWLSGKSSSDSTRGEEKHNHHHHHHQSDVTTSMTSPSDVTSPDPVSSEGRTDSHRSVTATSEQSSVELARGATSVLLLTPGLTRVHQDGLLAHIFNLNDDFLYVFEPCSAILGAKHRFKAHRWRGMPCMQVLDRLASCKPSSEDMAALLSPHNVPTVGMSRILVNSLMGIEAHNISGGTAVFTQACRSRIVVLHERYMEADGSFPELLALDSNKRSKVLPYGELLRSNVVLGVKDFRDVISDSVVTRSNERNALVTALCDDPQHSPLQCVERLCRAGVSTFSAMMKAKDRRFFFVKSEDLWEEPRLFAERLYHWIVGDDTLALKDGGHANLTDHKISLQLPSLLDRFLQLSIDGSDAQHRSSFRGFGETLTGVESVEACIDAFDALGYQHSVMNAKPLTVLHPKQWTFSHLYPSQIRKSHWSAVCGAQSSVIDNTRGHNGQARGCDCFFSPGLADCRWRLRTASKCQAATFKDSKCCLHDRTVRGYSVGHDQGAKHVVKMIEGQDPCMVIPTDELSYLSPPDSSLSTTTAQQQGVPTNLELFDMLRTSPEHSIHAHRTLTMPHIEPTDANGNFSFRFYMYDDPVSFQWRYLISCYRQENNGISPWADERWPELAQNTGQLWVHEALSRHPLRTKDPNEASLFVVSVETYISSKLKNSCRGTDHFYRMKRAAQIVSSSPHFRRKGGRDHLLVPIWWGAWKSWGMGNEDPSKSLWELLKDTATLVTYDEFFARDWKKIILAPYVPHALLTSLETSPPSPLLSSVNDPAFLPPIRYKRRRFAGGTGRSISFFFRGGVLHGVDCKKNGTWVRRAAYEMFKGMRRARFAPTENLKHITKPDGTFFDWVGVKTRRSPMVQKVTGSFKVADYANELRNSRYCLHFRGDTSTSRRVYDAIAAGCVPVFISDNTHLPFTSSVDWGAFTVFIPESELLQGPEHARRVFEEIDRDQAALRRRQQALEIARHDLIYGVGSPLNASKTFHSRVTEHILEEAFLLSGVQGQFRRYPETFEKCDEQQT